MRQELIDAYNSLLDIWVAVPDSTYTATDIALTKARQIIVDELTDEEWAACLRRNGL